MNAKTTSDNLIIKEFTAHKQIKLFSSLKEAQVSGQLTFSDLAKGNEWYLYLYLGEMVYGTGGRHPLRRWQRNLVSNLPQIPFQLSSLQAELTERKVNLKDNVWEYEQLARWVDQQIITTQQAETAIAFALEEILFDLTQVSQVVCRLNQSKVLSPKLELVDSKDLIERVHETWSNWEDVGIADRMPNMAPIILQP